MKKEKFDVFIKLLGFGELGKAIYDLISNIYTVDIVDTLKGMYGHTGKFEYLIVVIPYYDDFINNIKGVMKYHDIRKCIIFSTVPIGTVEEIPNAVHVPIEGRHPNFDLLKWRFFMGYNLGNEYYRNYIDFFSTLGKSVRPVPSTRITEAIKLLSTTMYGVNIEFMRYVEEVFKEHNVENDKIKAMKVWGEYTNSYNYLYSDLGEEGIQRYNLTPPKGEIGGHCIRENAKFLKGLFPFIVQHTYDCLSWVENMHSKIHIPFEDDSDKKSDSSWDTKKEKGGE